MSKDKNAVALGKKSYEARKHKHDSEYMRELVNKRWKKNNEAVEEQKLTKEE